MKLPLDQRREGEALFAAIAEATGAAAPAMPVVPRWRKILRGAVRWLRAALDGPDRVDIPDRLRDDAGLPPAEPQRVKNPFDRPPQW